MAIPLLAGCESDADKLQRLRSQESLALLSVLAAESQRDDLVIQMVDSLVVAGELDARLLEEDAETKLLYLHRDGAGFPDTIRAAMAKVSAAEDALLLARRDVERVQR